MDLQGAKVETFHFHAVLKWETIASSLDYHVTLNPLTLPRLVSNVRSFLRFSYNKVTLCFVKCSSKELSHQCRSSQIK